MQSEPEPEPKPEPKPVPKPNAMVLEISPSKMVVHYYDGNVAEVDPESVHKLENAQIPINVVAFEDAADVFGDLAVSYSNNARTEEIQNIDKHHRRRPEFCSLLGITSGGETHHNVHARCVMLC